MGFVFTKIRITNPTAPNLYADVELLTDSGALYSSVPTTILEGIGIKPIDTGLFQLADGSKIERKIGLAYFSIGNKMGASRVIFAEDNDQPLLGVVTLEELGLMLDPVSKTLKPAQLFLM